MQRSKQRSSAVKKTRTSSATKVRAAVASNKSAMSTLTQASNIPRSNAATVTRVMTKVASASAATVIKSSTTPHVNTAARRTITTSQKMVAPSAVAVTALPKRFQTTETPKKVEVNAPTEANIVVDAASGESDGFDLDAWEHRLETYRNKQESSLTPKQKQILDEWGESYASLVGPAQVQYNIFVDDPQFTVSKRLIGPPGTMEFPTMVFSPKPYRIVGCNGTVDNPHVTGWFSMEGYLKHMCPTCGQIFQLTNNPDDLDLTYTEKVDNMQHFLGH